MEGAGSAPARCWAAAPRRAVIILVPVQVSPPQRGFRQGRNIGGSVPRFFFLLLGEGRGKNSTRISADKEPRSGDAPTIPEEPGACKAPPGSFLQIKLGCEDHVL